MEQQRRNKEFIVQYYNAVNGIIKTRELLEQYVSDPGLIEHILFFDSVFPKYSVYSDEMTAEGNRVVVRARAIGRHEGNFNGIPPTYRNIEIPFVVSYEIENGRIIHHWLIADQMLLMEQLGVMKEPQE